jgi:MFS family permease
MMGLIGAVFLIGIVVGCSFVTRLGDVYGRKPVYLAGLTLNMLLILTLVVNKNVWVAYACIFLLGISITARYYVGYTYNLEFQPKKTQVIVSTIQFMTESCVYLIDIAYFTYISDNWAYLQIPNIILNLVGIIFIAQMPESPRFLIASKQFNRARLVFKRIAKVNGMKRAHCHEFVFDKEAEMAAQLPVGFDLQVQSKP